jgi:hypothetical protein
MMGEIGRFLESDCLYGFPQIRLFFQALAALLDSPPLLRRVLRAFAVLLRVGKLDRKMISPVWERFKLLAQICGLELDALSAMCYLVVGCRKQIDSIAESAFQICDHRSPSK